MSGPWARYGEDARPGDEDGAAENPSPPPNPYLSSGSAAPAGQQPSPDAAPAAFWNRPPPPNPYLANPYLHDPVHRSPYASQTDEPHPFRTTYAPNPYVREGPVSSSGQTKVSPVYGRSSPDGQLTADAHAAGSRGSGRPSEARGSLIVAVVVMVAIVIASIAILFNRPATDRATVPGGAPSTGVSSTARAQAVKAPPSSSATPARPTGKSAAPSKPTSPPAVSAAARLAATSWVEAINRQRVGPAQALSCAAVKAKITAAFVASVDGSVRVTSIVKDPSTGIGTLNFTYQKTTDTARQQDQLSLVTEGGTWKICR